MKVVFHINELTKWLEAKSNVKNLLKLVPDATIIVSVNGQGIKGYLDPLNAEFLDSKITFHACANALRGRGIAKEALPSHVVVVPAGVLDIIELQEKGYAYIKP
ncbi:MAG: DsrE family protein [Enterococcus lacertideformus]|uniref:DsrE family protein n=1 Tax=Enterococcus lacertideformus TaxID=2771493 RepID=A0A931B3J8_9ENTE|nr:DsrE family protein [Enterococcus lacertideformus]